MVNDTSIMAGVILFFVAVGTLLPVINATFDPTVGLANNTQVTELMARKEILSENSTTICVEERFNLIFTYIPFESCYDKSEVDTEKIIQRQQAGWVQYIASIGSMFFWTFGELPHYLDLLLFVPLRLLLVFLIYRAFRAGSG